MATVSSYNARAAEKSRAGEKPPLTERVSTALSNAGDNIKQSTSRNNAAESNVATARPTKQKSSAPRTRRARLRLTRLDPWSVMKTAFLLSIAFGIVTVVSVAIVWGVLGAAGVWESINASVQQVVGGDTASTFDVEDYLGTSRVMGFTMIVAVVDVILITAMATLAAFLYNLSAALLGGLEVTLAEDDR